MEAQRLAALGDYTAAAHLAYAAVLGALARRARIRLLPRNPEHQPIEVGPGQDFAIEGVYCGLVRRS